MKCKEFDEVLIGYGDDKDSSGLTWPEIRDILNQDYMLSFSDSYYRKRYQSLIDNNETHKVDDDEEWIKLAKEKVKVRDERNQTSALIRALAREETLKDIAHDCALTIGNTKFLPDITKLDFDRDEKTSAILLLGDWHYGLDVNLFENVYNPDVAKDRVAQLAKRALELCVSNNVENLYIVNLGDMISGRIHLQLRVNSRIDAVTQTIEVSELLAEFIHYFTSQFNCHYVSVIDNHSRIEPNKKESIQLESLSRITDWYLKERLKDDNIEFIDNQLGEDIATFEVDGHSVLAIHGDKDSQKNVIESLTSFTGAKYDLILSAHLHHFSMDEKDGTEFVCNSSLIGADDYSHSLRLKSQPSQTLIISKPEDITNIIYKIKLD